MFVFALSLLVAEILTQTTLKSAPVVAIWTFDAAISIILFLLSIVAFCLLTNDWRQTDSSGLDSTNKNAVQASLAFLFFSFWLWVRC